MEDRTFEINNIRCAILHSDVKREYFATEDHYITEKDATRNAEIIAENIRRIGPFVEIIAADENLVDRLKEKRFDMVFNLVDSFKGNEYLSSIVPGVLELLGIPYTGVGILGQALNYNKFVTQSLLQASGIPVPRFQLISNVSDRLDPSLRFPLISKLNEVHGAVEITEDAVSKNSKHLTERIKYLISTYDMPILLEEYIAGREVTAVFFESVKKKVYMAEKLFLGDREFSFITFSDQWLDGPNRFVYQRFEDELLKKLVKKASEILRVLDYGKFDIRIDNSGRFHFIDSNTNPAFGPREIGAATSEIMHIYHVDFDKILRRIIINTLKY